jgi:superfamily II DNA helicase RecQ
MTFTSKGRPSRFLRELELQDAHPPRPPGTPAAPAETHLLTALKGWRLSRARSAAVPAYVIFPDRTLEEITRVRPRDWAGLAGIHGVGPAKLERYADELLEIVRRAAPTRPDRAESAGKG